MGESLQATEENLTDIAEKLSTDSTLSYVQRRSLARKIADCFSSLQKACSSVIKGGFELAEDFQHTRIVIHDTRNPTFLKTWVQHGFDIIDILRNAVLGVGDAPEEEDIQCYLVKKPES